jgi:hypothetical protein
MELEVLYNRAHLSNFLLIRIFVAKEVASSFLDFKIAIFSTILIIFNRVRVGQILSVPVILFLKKKIWGSLAPSTQTEGSLLIPPVRKTLGLYHKTFYGCNLWIFVIS